MTIFVGTTGNDKRHVCDCEIKLKRNARKETPQKRNASRSLKHSSREGLREKCP